MPFLQEIVEDNEVLSSQWYYLDKDRNQITISAADLKQEYKRSIIITDETIVWKEGMSEWRAISHVPSLRKYLSFEDPHLKEKGSPPKKKTFTDEDGTVYIWDHIMEMWQKQPTKEGDVAPVDTASTYRFDENGDDIDDTEISVPNMAREEDKKKRKKNNKKKVGPVSSVYVQGLPIDTTEEEVALYFSKCGVLRLDAATDLPMIKLYKNASGEFKGDALVHYLRPESVDLAIQMLGGFEMRDG